MIFQTPPQDEDRVQAVPLGRRGGVWGTRAASGSPGEAFGERLAAVERNPAAWSELLITVAEAARRLSVGRSHLYLLLQRGSLRSIHIGRSRRIAVRDLERFVADLVAAIPEPNG
jgi:excisionase family DNA binding protein